MKDEAKKKIGFLIIVILLAATMYFQWQTQKERQKHVEREASYPKEHLDLPEYRGNIKEEDKEMLKQKQEETQLRYFKDQADWAGIGEGED